MTFQTVVLLLVVGFFAGLMSGLIGIGGGIVVVPAMVYVLGVSQHTAQGTSLLLMLPPVGILAVMNYYKAGHINWGFGMVTAAAFVVGGYWGAKLSLKLSPAVVKLIFGAVLFYVSLKMISSGYKDNKRQHEHPHTTTGPSTNR